MSITSFHQLAEITPHPNKVRIGVVYANDLAALQSLFDKTIRLHIFPVLIGPKKKILQQMEEKNYTNYPYELVEAANEEAAAQIGTQLVHEKKIDCLMKGHLQTRTFLKAIVSKEHGLVSDSLLSHISVNQLPNYHKLLLTTDGGMVAAPTYEEKKKLLHHAIIVMQSLGIKKPKIGVLGATELVNPNIQSSVEAEKLMLEFEEKFSDNCFIDGPISLDLALSQEIASIKEYTSAVAGDADILLGPDITTMNVLGKSMTLLAKGKMAGLIMGAQIPIILTSRGSDAEEKKNAILLAMSVSRGGKI